MNLLKDNIKKLYFKFLIPSLGSAMVMSIYTLTDAIVIGKGVGADALAALSITTPLLCILMSTGILFGVGGSVHMSVHRGSGNKAKADSYFTTSFVMTACLTALLWLVYGTCMPSLLRLMGANDTLFPYAISYMHYINMFLPVAVFSNFIAIFVRADGDPNRAMAGVLMGGVFNIVMDIVLVFPLKCGIGGAALASMIGMIIQVLVASSHFLCRQNRLHLTITRNRSTHTASGAAAPDIITPDNTSQDCASAEWSPSRSTRSMHTDTGALHYMKNIMTAGIPSFFNEFANGFIVLLFNIQILKYCGENALSIYSVISNCVILFNSLFTGVGQSVQPVISTNHGAGKTDRISSVKKMAYTTILIMGAVFSLAGVLFPRSVCGIFIDMNDTLGEIADFGIRAYFFAFVPFGINLMTSYYLQAILKSGQSLCISLLRNIILSSACILTFPVLIGGNSLWFVAPVIETATLIVSLAFLARQSVR